jgi:hypothetical protein
MSNVMLKIISEYYSKYGGTVYSKERSNRRPDAITQ